MLRSDGAAGDKAAGVGMILGLGEVSRKDAAVAGNKAATLGELLQSGFTVPQGYILTTSAFGRFVRENGLDLGAEVQPGRQVSSIPSDVSAALSTILEKLGGGLLAVRSSCTSEDLDNSSFAGQYETVLGVKGRAELEDAVKACWLSMFGKRAIQYTQARNKAGTDAGMAVLVQKLIRADSAGVAFSVNPVTGVREVVVNAIRGLGDRLVSGTATPDYWVVGDRATCVSRVENSISEEEALQIADLAKKVESHFGAPQDIEWAISGGRLFLLQARPITTVAKRASVGPSARRVEPVPIPIVVPEGHWTIDRDHWPMPASPMVVSFALKDVNAWLKQMTEDLGLPLDGIEFRLIGGWWYVRIVPPGGKDRRPPPEWLLRILVRVAPSMRRRVEKMKEAVRSDLMGKYGEAWRNEWRPEYIRRRNELVAVDLKAISDEHLYSHLSAVLDYNRYVMEIHFRYIHPISFDLGYFGVLCQDHLKWDSQRTLNLLGGLSSSDSEPGRRMAALANHARANPSLAAAIKQSIRTGSLEDALSADSSFSKEFRAYLNDFGGATTGYDLSYPTLAEMPVELLRLIDVQMSMGYDPSKVSLELQRRRAAGEEEINRSDLPGELKSKLKSSLARTRNSYGILDEETFYGLISQGIVRGTLLEVGSRLAAKGVIENRDDIFMLTLDEGTEALLKGGNRVQLVNKRLGERMWAIANPGPASYGKAPPPPPSPSVFPAQAQRFMRAVMWTLGLTILGRLPAGDGRQLTGTPASPGRYEGICRVVKDETEFEKIQPGDVLVCVSTTPSWSAVLSVIGALVTEAGGVLSHPAIVAREYGIPAVLSLERATEKLRDGQRVRVDGDLGAVTLVEGR